MVSGSETQEVLQMNGDAFGSWDSRVEKGRGRRRRKRKKSRRKRKRRSKDVKHLLALSLK